MTDIDVKVIALIITIAIMLVFSIFCISVGHLIERYKDKKKKK